MPPATLEQVRVALLTEIGELAQELKPDWAWWKKPGDARTVNPERVLSEAADVGHFALLADVVRENWHQESYAIEQWSGTLPKLICDLEQQARYSFGGYGTWCALASIVKRYGFTPDDLIRAYWEKSEENLRRWQASREGQA